MDCHAQRYWKMIAEKQHYKRRNYKLTGLTLLRIFAVGYVAVVLWLMYNETSLVYPGMPPSVGNWQPNFACETIRFRSADGTELEGWFLPHGAPQRDIVLFHGNAENIAATSAAYGDRLRDELQANVLVFDYRGFGNSKGTPSERALIEDGIAAVDWLSQRVGKPPEEMIFYGSSLGGGVAIGAAESRQPRILIVDRTFDSLVGVAGDSYPLIPVSWLMRNRFPSAERLARLPVPLIQSHFRDDELISLARAKRLFAAAPSPLKVFIELDGGGHLAPLPAAYWQRLREAVAELESHLETADEEPRR